MGLSSNQARFLSLTARQIDLEHRVQQICQRRLRLSNELQRAAQAYNDQTSDRRLYINTLGSYSSANSIIGPITHDNIADNQQYALLTPENLYDNGYHLFINGELLDIDGTGAMRIATGATGSFSSNTAPYYNVGDWSDNIPPLYWKVMSKNLNTPNITVPLAGQSGAQSNSSTSPPTSGIANTTQVNGAWTGGSIVQDPTTGAASQIFTRTCSVQAVAPGVPQTTPFIKLTNSVTTVPTGYTAITTATQLQTLLNTNPSANYILMNDIDMSSLGTFSDAVITNGFSGTLDGNGYAIKNFTIDTNHAPVSGVGLFKATTAAAHITNLALENVNISADNNNVGISGVGALVGSNQGTISNCYVDSSSNILGTYQYTGGLVGFNYGTIGKCFSAATVKGANWKIGGLVGGSQGSVSHSYSSGNVWGPGRVGGFIGEIDGGTVSDCYSTGNISSNASSEAGGFVGALITGTVTNSYATGNIPTGGANQGGFLGYNSPYTNSATNFYKNNMSTDNSGAINGNTTALPTGGWSPAIWDKSGVLPVFKTPSSDMHTTTTWTETITKTDNPGVTYNTAAFVDPTTLEPGLRNGSIKLAKTADPMTQDPVSVAGTNEKFEYVDWRLVPIIADDLYEANDEQAQQMYEKITRDVNSQDKQLQLEQTSVETEYNAVRSEKEAVEKVIDNNAKSSFKYFS